MKSSLKVASPILVYWLTMSEVDVVGMAVEIIRKQHEGQPMGLCEVKKQRN